ncbi:MAG: biotin/lipoyl-binding protein [Candidatus Riflebacteria bacterium]|nr:biotin/lipoyl-binding protein [Candidatus Riflebacteria bacterium]
MTKSYSNTCIKPVAFRNNAACRRSLDTNRPIARTGGFSCSFIIYFILCAAILSIAGWGLYLHYRERVSTDDAQIDGHMVPVASRINGCVEKVLVEDNQAVHTGDLIVKLDPRDLQIRVDQASATVNQTIAVLHQANAALNQAKASLHQAKAAPNQAKAQQEGARADVDKARFSFEQAKGSELLVAEATLESRASTLEKARSDLERVKPLAERQEISRQQFDAYHTAAEVAESEWKAAQRHLASLKQEAEIRGANVNVQGAKVSQAVAEIERSEAVVEVAEAEIERAKAGVERAEAEVEQARANLDALLLQLSYTGIKASVDGVVTARTVETGQIIQPGQGLMILVPLKNTWVTANFKETQLQDVHTGQNAEVSIDLSGKVVHGKVDSIAGSTGSRMSLLPPENAVGNFVKVVQRIPVKILLDQKEVQDEILRPGMNVDVTIFTR